MKLIITGGAGFIGSALIRYLLTRTEHAVVNVDKLTYAANLASLEPVAQSPRYRFVKLDICEGEAFLALLRQEQPDGIIHLAAESHVDRSIDGPAAFIQTNVVGTFTLLEAARRYWQDLPGERRGRFKFHHVSTDEVFGSLGDEGRFSETTPYDPRSPYSASKASSDHLVRAWHHTYGLPVVLSNCSNNYGPYQFPEKLIPLTILNALHGRPLPVYGQGTNVRDWLYVDDHAQALCDVFTRGSVGESYAIGGDAERRNIDVVHGICDLVDEALERAPGTSRQLVHFVTDRPGHDQRYAIDAGKIRRELGWQPSVSFEQGLRQTVEWYLSRRDWWEPLVRDRYAGQRLGLAAMVSP